MTTIKRLITLMITAAFAVIATFSANAEDKGTAPSVAPAAQAQKAEVKKAEVKKPVKKHKKARKARRHKQETKAGKDTMGTAK